MPQKRNGLPQQAYEKIKEILVKGELRPGEPILETALAEKFRMSRTPVREALSRLEQEGFIKNVSGRVRTVAEITLQDLIETYEIREMIEGMAARLLAPRINPEQVDYLSRLAQNLDIPGIAPDQNELEFHEYIIRECGNKRLKQFTDTVRDQWVQLAFGDMLIRKAVAEPVEQHTFKVSHKDIVQALASRDPDKAESMARAHVSEAREQIFRSIV